MQEFQPLSYYGRGEVTTALQNKLHFIYSLARQSFIQQQVLDRVEHAPARKKIKTIGCLCVLPAIGLVVSLAWVFVRDSGWAALMAYGFVSALLVMITLFVSAERKHQKKVLGRSKLVPASPLEDPLTFEGIQTDFRELKDMTKQIAGHAKTRMLTLKVIDQYEIWYTHQLSNRIYEADAWTTYYQLVHLVRPIAHSHEMNDSELTTLHAALTSLLDQDLTAELVPQKTLSQSA